MGTKMSKLLRVMSFPAGLNSAKPKSAKLFGAKAAIAPAEDSAVPLEALEAAGPFWGHVGDVQARERLAGQQRCQAF